MAKASEKAYHQIRSMILSGKLAPGDQIVEEALAEQCGVSRTPVREALRRLEADLLIVRNDAKRSFVGQWSLADAEDSFDLRAMLESHAARRASTRISAAQLAELKAYNLKVSKAIEQTPPDVSAFLEYNRNIHHIIMSAAKSERLTAMLTKLVEQPVVLRTAMQYDLENLTRSHREHEELVSAFERADPDWAAAVMSGHIRRAFHAYADAHASDLAELERNSGANAANDIAA